MRHFHELPFYDVHFLSTSAAAWQAKALTVVFEEDYNASNKDRAIYFKIMSLRNRKRRGGVILSPLVFSPPRLYIALYASKKYLINWFRYKRAGRDHVPTSPLSLCAHTLDVTHIQG